MKSVRDSEPGVLPTFRLFMGVQFAISLLSVVAHRFAFYTPQSEVIAISALIGLESGLCFIYLSFPNFLRSLKSFYLPLGIVLASLGSVLEPWFVLNTAGANSQAILEVVLWQQIIVLFIPLIVISWQYRMPQVILFCGLTGILNIIQLTYVGLPGSSLGIIFVELIAFSLVGHMIVSLVKVQRDQRQSLTQANQRLAQYAATVEQLTVSRERNRLARELHDVLAHTLSGVAVELEGLRATLGRDPEQSRALLNNSLQAVRAGLTETRRALQELRAQPLEDLGLALAVRSLAESYASRDDFKIELIIDDDPGDYPDNVQQCVYRIAQEALANAADHAQPKNVRVVLKREQGCLLLIIRDDGCGFDPADPANKLHYGLLGMRERAEMIGGSLSVESWVGEGTQVVFSYKGGS